MKQVFYLLHVTILAFSLHPFNVSAQSRTDSARFKISAINADFGGNVVFMPLTTDDYFSMKNTVADQSQFLNNLDGYTLDLFTSVGGSVAPNISIGLSPFSQKKNRYNHNQELRVKLGMGVGIRRSFSFTKAEYTPYDTLTSALGNPDVWIDSVHYSNAYYTENVYEVNIGAMYLFKTPTHMRFHLYTGVGGEFGFAFQNYITIDKNEGSYFNTNRNSTYGNIFYGFADNYNYNTYRSQLTSNASFLRLYVPLGMSYRLSNKYDFWRQLYLYAHVSGGLEFHFNSNGGNTYVNSFGSFAFFGLRYVLP